MLVDRFWSKVDKGGPDECWRWNASITEGYGRVKADGGQRSLQAHRVAYELEVGPIPDGYQVDHLCHNADRSCSGGPTCPHRACVNPGHLEAVAQAENVRRGRTGKINNHNAVKTRCPAGHRYDESNTYRRGDGYRSCRTCSQERERARWSQMKEKARG